MDKSNDEAPLHSMDEFLSIISEITNDTCVDVTFTRTDTTYMSVRWRSRKMGGAPLIVTKEFNDLYEYSYKTLNDITEYITRIEKGV